MAMISFSAGQVMKSADFNSNYANCVACDTARTVTVTHTWTASQTFTGGWTAGAACTISTGGLTVTAGGLTVTAGGLTITAGALTMGTAQSRIIPGATDFAINDHANANNNFIITDAGVATIRAGLTVTSGGLTVTAGGMTVSAGASALQALTATTGTFSGLLVGNAGLSTTTGAFTGTITISAAASKIVPGATSLSFRNNADSADNLKITDAGAATIRAGLTVTAGGATITAGGLTVSASGITVTGNSTITGTLGGLTGLTVASGNATLTAGNLTFGAASAKVIPGATSLLFRNNADSATNLSIADGGAAIFRSTVAASSFGPNTSTAIGFYGSAGSTQIQVTGSKGGNAALTSLLTALNTLGLISDLST